MINAQMKDYNYRVYEETNNYGQPTLSEIKGKVKLAINLASQTTQDNILYQDCSYTGLTNDAAINDTYVVEYDKEQLKVRYVNPMGRFKQVFMSRM